MFTGIVEEAGTVARVTDDEGGRRLRIETDEMTDFSHGESISVSGVCLTVEEWGDQWFSVFTASETLEKSTLDAVSEGDRVNLERALPADGRLDGHVVQGHVDTTTEVRDVEQVGDDWTFTFALPEGYEQYVAEKGSIALDGISLTVADVDDSAGIFSVAVIPTTHDLTTLAERDPGDRVNVEVDVMAKYVERLEGYRSDSVASESTDIADSTASSEAASSSSSS
ncbi:riboflavin synthase [Halobacterium zhouii]|uniref:riboflavin synthase n=1 Tax=Halobacterium zhouii TaxID=2902624 RepID=UPI001E420CE8|nr:riboflavin synthase [Halobacterium zhouii]